MRAVGLSPRQVFAMIGLEYLFIAVIGLIIGTIAGLRISATMLSFLNVTAGGRARRTALRADDALGDGRPRLCCDGRRLRSGRRCTGVVLPATAGEPDLATDALALRAGPGRGQAPASMPSAVQAHDALCARPQGSTVRRFDPPQRRIAAQSHRRASAGRLDRRRVAADRHDAAGEHRRAARTPRPQPKPLKPPSLNPTTDGRGALYAGASRSKAKSAGSPWTQRPATEERQAPITSQRRPGASRGRPVSWL